MIRAVLVALAWPLVLAGQATPALVITGVDVLTMTDGPTYRRGQTVVIEGDRITAIGRSPAMPAGARRIDGAGLVAIPGLADMHVHLEGQPERWLGAFLGYGVTTVLNLRGGAMQLALRDRINRGETLGPRVFTSGPFVNEPDIMTVRDAANAVAEHQRAGYDVLKVHGPQSGPVYRALLDTARAAGIAVVGHAPRNLAFDSVLVNRQVMIAHAEELIYTRFTTRDSTAFGDLPARMARAGIWLTPTLSTFHGIATQWARPAAADSALGQPEAAFFGDGMRGYWRNSNPYTGRDTAGARWAASAYQFQRPLVRALHRAGVRLLAGTDTPVPIMVPGASLHLELAELRGLGLSTYDALLSATRNPGDFLREAVNPAVMTGRLEVGYSADLVLVRGDPLANPDALRAPVGLVLRGRYLDPERLATLRAIGR